MSNPKDTIMVTFTREELHLLREIFERDEYCYLERMTTGKPDGPLSSHITKLVKEALEDEEYSPCEGT